MDEVQSQAGIIVTNGEGTAAVSVVRGRRTGENILTETELLNLDKRIYELGRPKGVQIKDAHLILELSGINLTMMPAGGEDILSLEPAHI